MIHAFAAHLVARYGLEEVSSWKFEVWNEPNLDFWGGTPKQATYWSSTITLRARSNPFRLAPGRRTGDGTGGLGSGISRSM